jgi:Domain of unknown function (DUF4173)
MHMTSLTSPQPDVHSGLRISPLPKLVIALALTGFADWLFYDQRSGISVVVFAVALAAVALLANLDQLTRRRAGVAGLVLLAGLAPVVEELNALSLVFVVLALAMSIALVTGRELSRTGNQLAALRDLYLIGPFRLVGDVISTLKVQSLTRGIALWFVPAVFGTIFVILFASANPLIEQWISLLHPSNAASKIDIWRTLFWLAALSLVWPFVHVRWRRGKPKPLTAVPAATLDDAAPAEEPNREFLGAPEILRSLILFNLLFAVQTVLDLIFLWGNAGLPAGISYADYAHRGAYPLIATALLAAAFVLVAMRPGGPAEKSPVIRPLVYVFVAQNVMLVASSILRLHLYVEVYLLTYWRIAAFVWMLLVAVGLVLIVTRIWFGHSNAWLVRTNMIVLACTLYICALINFDAIIADYNVTHSKEAGGKGVELDIAYLAGLGPQALPAIDKAKLLGVNSPCLVTRRDHLVEMQSQDMSSWRSWGLRSYRLQRYLDQRAKHVTD